MEIITKHNFGDEVFILVDNNIKRGNIVGVSIKQWHPHDITVLNREFNKTPKNFDSFLEKVTISYDIIIYAPGTYAYAGNSLYKNIDEYNVFKMAKDLTNALLENYFEE